MNSCSNNHIFKQTLQYKNRILYVAFSKPLYTNGAGYACSDGSNFLVTRFKKADSAMNRVHRS